MVHGFLFFVFLRHFLEERQELGKVVEEVVFGVRIGRVLAAVLHDAGEFGDCEFALVVEEVSLADCAWELETYLFAELVVRMMHFGVRELASLQGVSDSHDFVVEVPDLCFYGFDADFAHIREAFQVAGEFVHVRVLFADDTLYDVQER